MGVVEVDVGIFDGVAGVEKYLALAVELDGVGGFVDAVGGGDEGFLRNLLGDDSAVLLVHIFDVADGSAGGAEGRGQELPEAAGQH